MLKYARYIQSLDPSKPSILQVLRFPGTIALFWLRIAQMLIVKKLRLSKIIMRRVRRKTGIEIHPDAKVGKYLFIDHGMGVVIGQTAVIGDYCTIYHGVTLGSCKPSSCRRHPKIGNHCLIGAGAILLGPITIGDHVKVGAGAIVVDDVADGKTVISPKGIIIDKKITDPM